MEKEEELGKAERAVHEIRQWAKKGCAVLGICGSYQMLGEHLSDVVGTEAEAGTVEAGLNLLPVETFFEPVRQKVTVQRQAQFLLDRISLSVLSFSRKLSERLVTCTRTEGAAEQPMKKHLDGPSSHLDQETWRQILTAAKDLFFAKGYKGVSMKEIADAVQVTPAGLYYHFPKGKEDLFTKMIQTLFVDEGLAGIDQILGTTQDLRERLNVLTASLLTLPIDEQFTMLLRDAKEHIKDAENQRIILSLRDRIKQQVMGLFQVARDAGEIRTDIPVPVLVSLYMGMLRELKSIQGSRQVSHLVTVLLDGIASPAQPDQH